jgi:hypothetical protein
VQAISAAEVIAGRRKKESNNKYFFIENRLK